MSFTLTSVTCWTIIGGTKTYPTNSAPAIRATPTTGPTNNHLVMMMVILLFFHSYFSIIIPDLDFFNFSFNCTAISVDWIAVALHNKTTQHLARESRHWWSWKAQEFTRITILFPMILVKSSGYLFNRRIYFQLNLIHNSIVSDVFFLVCESVCTSDKLISQHSRYQTRRAHSSKVGVQRLYFILYRHSSEIVKQQQRLRCVENSIFFTFLFFLVSLPRLYRMKN